jgi:excisionase family DNA binding protein
VLPSAELYQPTLLAQRWGCECRRTCAVASWDLVLDGKALLRTAKDYRRLGDHQARAIRLEDAGRRQSPAMAGDFPTIHLSATTGRKEMINELDRLMTITDLSEMLGVPVDTLYGWRHRGEGPEGYRIGRHVRYRRAAVEAWLDTQADRRQR